jgi:hypothetical protein
MPQYAVPGMAVRCTMYYALPVAPAVVVYCVLSCRRLLCIKLEPAPRPAHTIHFTHYTTNLALVLSLSALPRRAAPPEPRLALPLPRLPPLTLPPPLALLALLALAPPPLTLAPLSTGGAILCGLVTAAR